MLPDRLPAAFLTGIFRVRVQQEMVCADLREPKLRHILHRGLQQRGIPVGYIKDVYFLLRPAIQIIDKTEKGYAPRHGARFFHLDPFRKSPPGIGGVIEDKLSFEGAVVQGGLIQVGDDGEGILIGLPVDGSSHFVPGDSIGLQAKRPVFRSLLLIKDRQDKPLISLFAVS